MMRSLSAMLLFSVAACASAGGGPRTAMAPICGWTESAKSCAADADCPEDSTCVEGLGKEIVPETKDGLEAMPPYDRVHVRFCQSRACPKDTQPEPPTPESTPTPEPGPRASSARPGAPPL